MWGFFVSLAALWLTYLWMEALLNPGKQPERLVRIEPTSPDWKSGVFPLNYSRFPLWITIARHRLK